MQLFDQIQRYQDDIKSAGERYLQVLKNQVKNNREKYNNQLQYINKQEKLLSTIK